ARVRLASGGLPRRADESHPGAPIPAGSPRRGALFRAHGPAPAPADGRPAPPAVRQPVSLWALGAPRPGPPPDCRHSDAVGPRPGGLAAPDVDARGRGSVHPVPLGLAHPDLLRGRAPVPTRSRPRARDLLRDGDPLLVADHQPGPAAPPAD